MEGTQERWALVGPIRVCREYLKEASRCMIQEGHDVGLKYPLHLAPVHDLVEGPYGVMGTAPGSEPLRAVQKVWLVNGFEHLTHGVLDLLVLERRHPNRPRLPCTLGDMDTSDRLMAVPLRLQPCVQPLEICFQFPPVLLLRDPIHASRHVGTLPAIRAFEGRHIDQMRQRVEPSFGCALRSFHYLPKSR